MEIMESGAVDTQHQEEEKHQQQKEEEGEEKHKQQRDQEGKEEEKHFHVLAVDDSFIDRKLLERLLKVSSYQGIMELINLLSHASGRETE
jgi:two-component response regulator (ARR-A family)